MSKFDEERMLRFNGKRPTAREKWTAFYRLYRISQGRGSYHDMEAADCFRVLFADWSFLRAAQCDGPATFSRNLIPTFLRKKMLELNKKRRLYGDHYEWMDRDKVVAGKMHETGIEVTPTEVAEVRRKVINLARQKAAELDVRLPTDDDDLLKWISQRKDRLS